MKINQAGIDLIKSFEGCRLTSYQDQAGVWTIGYGATGPDIGPSLTWTQAQAEERLVSDLCETERGCQRLLTVAVGPNQFSALVSFAYNLGLGSLKSSTLLRCVNSYHFKDAANEFTRWCKVGGIEIPGLLRRREAERELFLKDPTHS